MLDKRTMTELSGWTGYRVANLEYRPDEGWIRLKPCSKTMHCSRCGKQSQTPR